MATAGTVASVGISAVIVRRITAGRARWIEAVVGVLLTRVALSPLGAGVAFMNTARTAGTSIRPIAKELIVTDRTVIDWSEDVAVARFAIGITGCCGALIVGF